jgi:hypothetical protein
MLTKKPLKGVYTHKADRVPPPYTLDLDTDTPTIQLRWISQGRTHTAPCDERMYARVVGRKVKQGKQTAVVGSLNRMSRAKFLVVTQDIKDRGEEAVAVHVIPDESAVQYAKQEKYTTMEIRVNCQTGEMEIVKTVGNITLNDCFRLLEKLQAMDKVDAGQAVGRFQVTRAEGNIIELEVVE